MGKEKKTQEPGVQYASESKLLDNEEKNKCSLDKTKLSKSSNKAQEDSENEYTCGPNLFLCSFLPQSHQIDKYIKPTQKISFMHQQLDEQNHGFNARPTPNFGVFSKALVSNSPAIVRRDFGINSCCNTAPSFP